MRRAMICTTAVVAAIVTPAAAIAAARPGPTPAQIRSAVRHATHSRYLWATVNVCQRNQRGGVMGVRGQMPALGFPATLSMTTQLRQYDASKRRFIDVTGATAQHTTSLGTLRTGVHQDGAEFPYRVDTPMLDASVTFTWTRAGRRLAQVTRMTTGGHHSAAFGQPKGHSTASCRL